MRQKIESEAKRFPQLPQTPPPLRGSSPGRRARTKLRRGDPDDLRKSLPISGLEIKRRSSFWDLYQETKAEKGRKSSSRWPLRFSFCAISVPDSMEAPWTGSGKWKGQASRSTWSLLTRNANGVHLTNHFGSWPFLFRVMETLGNPFLGVLSRAWKKGTRLFFSFFAGLS